MTSCSTYGQECQRLGCVLGVITGDIREDHGCSCEFEEKHVDPRTGLGDVWIRKQYASFTFAGITILMCVGRQCIVARGLSVTWRRREGCLICSYRASHRVGLCPGKQYCSTELVGPRRLTCNWVPGTLMPQQTRRDGPIFPRRMWPRMPC